NLSLGFAVVRKRLGLLTAAFIGLVEFQPLHSPAADVLGEIWRASAHDAKAGVEERRPQIAMAAAYSSGRYGRRRRSDTGCGRWRGRAANTRSISVIVRRKTNIASIVKVTNTAAVTLASSKP